MKDTLGKINKQDENYKLFEENKKNKLLSPSAFVNILEDCFTLSKEEKEKLTPKEKKKKVTEKERITVIIPTHNRLKQLTKCIESITSQDYKNIEIIIIDDVSTDDTRKFYENHKDKRIRYLRNEKNLGMGLNRQKAFKVATGDFIIYCDDDDYFIDNTYFSDAIKIFQDKEINIICSPSYIHYEEENVYSLYELNYSEKIKSIDYLKRFQFDLKKPTSTFPAIFRKEVLDKANFKDMKMMNDSSIYLKALMMGGYTYKNEKIIGVYRVHGKNDTFNVKADFTIKNLKEKKKIYQYIKKNNLLENPKKWYEQETKITICHFLNGKEKSSFKRNQVLLWTKMNVSKELYKELKLSEKERKKNR